MAKEQMKCSARRTSRSKHSLLAIGYSLAAVLAASVGTQAVAQDGAQGRSQDRAQDRPAAFVDAASVVPGLIVEARYAGSHNFVGRPIDGYEAPRCLLTRPAAEALAQVARDLAPRGLVIKAFDCYRPVRAVANFMRWARDLNETAGKNEFYPDVDKRTLFRNGYISSRSGHSRGSTIDLTLANADGRELDMGTPFDFLDPKSWPSDASIGHAAMANRSELADAMRRRGFRPYQKEWWHFTLSHEPFPDTYFDFPVK
jgi:zinc D-Ala-D-Ala dipeptidase